MTLTTQAVTSTASVGLDHTTVKTHRVTGDAASDTDFGAVLSDVATQAISSLNKAETSAISGIQGKANARDVVDAVMQAEQSLQIALALRDKSLSAFQELNRMSI